MAATAVTFNGLDMNDGAVYITQDIDHAVAPQRNMPTFNLARANGAVITDSTFGIKTISHHGMLQDTTVSGLESKIDTFHQTMSGFKKNLDIGYAGSTRRYVATASKAEITRPVAGSPWAQFNVEYTVTEFGKDTANTNLFISAASTGASYTPALAIGGTAPLQPLFIQIVVTAATGLANKTITITTPTNVSLAIRRTWAVSDILTIDESSYSVLVNGVTAEFTGFFPSLGPSASTQVLAITNDFTTRTLTTSINYVKRYL